MTYKITHTTTYDYTDSVSLSHHLLRLTPRQLAHQHCLGHTVSPGAFGHAGAAGQIAWADPATGLSFAYVTNGIDAHMIRQAKRGTALSSRAAVCAEAD